MKLGVVVSPAAGYSYAELLGLARETETAGLETRKGRRRPRLALGLVVLLGALVFFPALLSLGPGKERKIRVGSTIPAGAAERTYRIFVEELPPARVSKVANAGTQVRVLTKMGVPIFVQPARPEPAGRIEMEGSEGGHLRFRVRNTGNAHFLLESMHVRYSNSHF